MTAQKQTCAGKIFRGYRYYGCANTGSHEHEGVMYCKTHHPPTVKAKRDKKQAEWESKYQERVKAEKAKADATSEMKRRANCFPDLLDALQSVYQWMDDQSDAQSKGGHATFDLTMLLEQRDRARAAIARATNKEPT